MHQTKIEYADRAWNPITGCLKDCKYCDYKKRVNSFSGDIRRNKGMVDKYILDDELYILNEMYIDNNNPFGFEPTYHRYRASALDTLKTPMNVAVSHNGEMFGPWIKDEYIKEIFDITAKYPRQRFLFLTAYPERYEELYKKGILPDGDNYWYGWSVTSGKADYNPDFKGGHKYIVIEPILDKVTSITAGIEWVIVGADKKKYKGRITPENEWIDYIVSDCVKKNIPLFMESSIEKYVSAVYKMYPIQLSRTEYSDKKKMLYEADCNMCNKHLLKRKMATFTVSYERGHFTKSIGFLCDDCYKKICEEYGFEYFKRERRDKSGKDKKLSSDTGTEGNT